ncbi:MAG TPA: folylpolyglutamate synthase/dihydrofolate synthase family protein [Actinomycetota bacterium]|jgi:dihydrofolate synthase/folylpolyglutamate synthase|nr:folylpolyglutamate synthase/dihydrofolate synthase family protein [Actinomycetota bacterium]
MDYHDAVAALYRRLPARMGPSLDRITRLAELLDHPERTAPAIHLTGTNGKTSTARMVASLLAAFGVGAGVYTSPHLQDVRERVATATRLISPEEFAETWAYLEPFLAEVDRASDQPVTFYEALTALAFTWFAELPVDAQVVEVGMGGTWDATNLVHGEVAVVNRVALDHPELGDTPAAVAAEKAGIIKRGATVVSQEQDDDVLAVIAERAARQEARLLLAGRDFRVERRRQAVGGQLLDLRTPGGVVPDVLVPLHGRHQADNAAGALVAVEAFLGAHEGTWGPGTDAPASERRLLDPDTVRAGFAAVTSPGRLEVVSHQPLVLLDGAHNPAGARALAEALLTEFVVDRRTLVVACLADKDLRGILQALAPATGRLIVTTNRSPRAAPAERLRKEAEALGLRAEVAPDVASAVQRALDGAGETEAVVVAGSLYTVGEARELLLGSE